LCVEFDRPASLIVSLVPMIGFAGMMMHHSLLCNRVVALFGEAISLLSGLAAIATVLWSFLAFSLAVFIVVGSIIRACSFTLFSVSLCVSFFSVAGVCDLLLRLSSHIDTLFIHLIWHHRYGRY